MDWKYIRMSTCDESPCIYQSFSYVYEREYMHIYTVFVHLFALIWVKYSLAFWVCFELYTEKHQTWPLYHSYLHINIFKLELNLQDIGTSEYLNRFGYLWLFFPWQLFAFTKDTRAEACERLCEPARIRETVCICENVLTLYFALEHFSVGWPAMGTYWIFIRTHSDKVLLKNGWDYKISLQVWVNSKCIRNDFSVIGFFAKCANLWMWYSRFCTESFLLAS